MTNIKVSVIQKARYGVLFLPVVWLLFSIWAVVNSVFPRVPYTGVQEVNTPPSVLEILSVVFYGCLTVWIFVKVLQMVKNHSPVSAELKSGFVFLLGFTLLSATTKFHLSQFLSYVGIAMTDVAAIIVIVTLLQGKPFADFKLYHEDIQIEKTS